MLRAKSLGAVTFGTNTLFIKEEFESSSVVSKKYDSIAGTHIVYEAEIHTPYITLESREYGIITEAQREALLTMWNTLGTNYTLTYDDDTTETVRMARESKILFTPLWEGACEFTATISLAKVI